jgi:capsular polysaccharide biosynthesis protein
MLELYSEVLERTAAIVGRQSPGQCQRRRTPLTAVSGPTLVQLYRDLVPDVPTVDLDVESRPVLIDPLASGRPSRLDCEGDRHIGGYRGLRQAEETAVIDLQGLLDRSPSGNLAILVDDRPSALGELIALAYPGLVLHRFHAETEKGRLHAQLAARGPYDVIVIDGANSSSRAVLFRHVFSHLKAGGTLFVRTFRAAHWNADVRPWDEHLWPVLAKLVPVRGTGEENSSWQQRDRIAMAEAVGRIVADEDHLTVSNRVSRYAKLREEEMNAILDIRGEELGVLVQRRPGTILDSRCKLRRNVELLKTHHDSFSVPPMSIREYRRAVCLPFGVAVRDNLILPETFRHNQYNRLSSTSLASKSHFFADVPPHEPSRRLEGPLFNLTSEYPSHFGHFMSEVVSRLWGWAPAKERHASLKVLLSRPREGTVPSFVYRVLAAYGIAEADIEIYGPDETVEVETLIGVTPMYSTPDYVHPHIADVWSTIGRNLAAETKVSEVPERIFVLRPAGSIRPCHNEEDVTERFVSAGFEPVRPESMSLADQAALFRGAEVIGGFAGSAMLGLMYCETPRRVVLVGSESYTSSNEYLVSSVRGHEIDQVLSVSDIRQPPNGWSRQAFRAGWSFDVDREGRLLDRVLADLDDPRPESLRAAYAAFLGSSPRGGNPPAVDADGKHGTVPRRAAVKIIKPLVGRRGWAALRSLRRR